MNRYRLQKLIALVVLTVSFMVRLICYAPFALYTFSTFFYVKSKNFLYSDRHERRAANYFKRRYGHQSY